MIEHPSTRNPIEENQTTQDQIQKIAELNDRLRTTFCEGGMIYHSEAVKQLSRWELTNLNFHLQQFDLFYGHIQKDPEKRKGIIPNGDRLVSWHIEYYDRQAWMAGSEKRAQNPEGVTSTYRVLVMDIVRTKSRN